MTSYATTDDVIALRGAMSADALERLNTILPICSAELRSIATKNGKDLNRMVFENEDVELMVKKGVVDASVNYYYSTENKEPIMTQFSQSAGGYTVSGTLANAGGAFYFPKQFLKDLGLKAQRVGTVEIFNNEFTERTDS